ncbi:hypothetical protein FO519_009491 [Halicephalobus sp. NKZ332]|nr:hypothetical protein FO519_009491 [Halicephalobus sp. NKZ332]
MPPHNGRYDGSNPEFTRERSSIDPKDPSKAKVHNSAAGDSGLGSGQDHSDRMERFLNDVEASQAAIRTKSGVDDVFEGESSFVRVWLKGSEDKRHVGKAFEKFANDFIDLANLALRQQTPLPTSDNFSRPRVEQNRAAVSHHRVSPGPFGDENEHHHLEDEPRDHYYSDAGRSDNFPTHHHRHQPRNCPVPNRRLSKTDQSRRCYHTTVYQCPCTEHMTHPPKYLHEPPKHTEDKDARILRQLRQLKENVTTVNAIHRKIQIR